MPRPRPCERGRIRAQPIVTYETPRAHVAAPVLLSVRLTRRTARRRLAP